MSSNCVLFFVFLLFPFNGCCSVTNRLPGFRGILPFELETGYVGIGEYEEVQLFYYFFKSERNPKKDPVMVWLAGGPACSSICGWAMEIGGILSNAEEGNMFNGLICIHGYFLVLHQHELVENNGTTPTLLADPDSWTKVASIIFLDQPAGTGFSYSRNQKGRKASDLTSAWQVDQFVRKWLLGHPEFLSNPFYVSGDSNSGKIVPPVALHISDGNDQGIKPQVNLKGYVVVNPLTYERIDLNARIPYAHRMALISDELYESLVNHCRGEYQIVDPGNVECSRALQQYTKCVENINIEITTDDLCEARNPKCKTYYSALSYYWANDEAVRRALGIREGSNGEWVRCNYDNVTYNYDIENTIPYHANLSIKGYRSFVVSGDHEMKVPHVGTQEWIRGLNYTVVDEWRPRMENGQVQGYTRTFANRMTFATVKGGGHTPEYKRHPYYVMFRRWIDGEPL